MLKFSEYIYTSSNTVVAVNKQPHESIMFISFLNLNSDKENNNSNSPIERLTQKYISIAPSSL